MQTDVTLSQTPGGRRVEVVGTTAAAPDRAWELLVDTDRWPDWGPSVTGVDCPDRWIRPGSRGEVRLPGGVWVPFEVTTFDPALRRWVWKVARVPATGHRVDPAPGGCRIVFELPLLAAGYVPVCRCALARIDRLLSGERTDG